MYADNNLLNLKSIIDYQNLNREEYGENEESNGEYTKEKDENNDSVVDYSFNYEKTVQWAATTIWLKWYETVKWLGGCGYPDTEQVWCWDHHCHNLSVKLLLWNKY